MLFYALIIKYYYYFCSIDMINDNLKLPIMSVFISITLAVNEEGEFCSMTVWTSHSTIIFSTKNLECKTAKSWLSRIELEPGKQYYNLTK